MPKIYLSPSTQESNPYITGSGSEEYNINGSPTRWSRIFMPTASALCATRPT